MPHEVHASIQVTLPDDPKEMADTLSHVAAMWANLLETMEPTPCTPTFSVNETRGGTKRTRKPSTKPAAAFLTETPAPEVGV